MSKRYDLLPSYYYEDNTDGVLLESAGKPLRDYKIYGETAQTEILQQYQQVEYIESTGTQYIKTGVIPNQNTGFDVTFLTKSEVSTSNYGAIFGARQDSSSNEFQLSTYAGTDSGILRFGNSTYAAGIISNEVLSTSLRNQEYTANDGSTTSLTNTFTSPCEITIFALNNNDSVVQHGKTQIYSLKLYDGDILIRDFIPCYRKSDNTIGMYDVVNGEFYVNNGTGTFLKGEDVITTFDTPTNKIGSVGNKITNIVDIDYILENNPSSTTSLERITFQDRDCIRWNAGSLASNLRIMQGKFKKNTTYTIKASVASSQTFGNFFIIYTDGSSQRINLQDYAPNFPANTFREIIVFTDSYRTVDYIKGQWSAGEWIYLDIDKFIIAEGVFDPPYVSVGKNTYGVSIYSNNRNLANPLSVYNFVSRVLYASNGLNNNTYIIIDENRQRILRNYAAAAYNTENYSDKAKIFKGIFKENTRYTISFDYRVSSSSDCINMGFSYTDGNYNTFNIPTDADRTQILHFTLTSQAGKTIDSVRLFYSNGTSYIYLDTLQIEEGTSKTKYVPYGQYDIYLDEPLRKIGDYVDYIDYRKQKLFRNVEVIDNTGTLTLEESLRGLAESIESNIELPTIATSEGTCNVSVNTTVQPSQTVYQYYREGI